MVMTVAGLSAPVCPPMVNILLPTLVFSVIIIARRMAPDCSPMVMTVARLSAPVCPPMVSTFACSSKITIARRMVPVGDQVFPHSAMHDGAYDYEPGQDLLGSHSGDVWNPFLAKAMASAKSVLNN
ncbi:MAG: hypothetical protein J3Q66DRAFT_369607 [Benniella sp.]|nr:MAG: hypothetical protein J3Q66DRAFT_369607 [Benniella sp.]